MRLDLLAAEFIKTLDERSFQHVCPGEGANGILFACPGCYERHGKIGGAHPIIIWFANPIGDAVVASEAWTPSPRWTRIGETLETLTLNQGIDVKHNCWHGFIRNGNAENRGCRSNGTGDAQYADTRFTKVSAVH